MSTMNYYVVLGIAEDAESDTIRSAFRTLARRYHPDAGAGSSTAEFQRALEAYETLSDPERRRLYDRELRDWRMRAAIVAQPMGARRVPEPLFASRTVSFGFPTRRATITRTTFFDDVFDERFFSTHEEWFWRWRVR